MSPGETLSFVLDGLEAYLELERELGVRAIEVGRTLLAPAPASKVESAPKAVTAAQPAAAESAVPPPGAAQTPRLPEAPSAIGATGRLDFVFIADRPLSPRAVEMMAKIVPAMGKTSETAPVVVSPPIPDARFFVFLGRAALARYMPGLRGEENRWLKTPKGKDVLLVKSPEEIVRFTTVTPALKKMKQDMWLALKTVLQRVRMEG